MRLLSPLQCLFFIGLLPIGALFCAENRAAASCGDYLRIASDRPDATASNAPHNERTPCHGPNCRENAPSLPVPAPAAPTVQNHSPDALLIPAAAIEEHPTSEPVAFESSDPSRATAEPIFHPPR